MSAAKPIDWKDVKVMVMGEEVMCVHFIHQNFKGEIVIDAKKVPVGALIAHTAKYLDGKPFLIHTPEVFKRDLAISLQKKIRNLRKG